MPTDENISLDEVGEQLHFIELVEDELLLNEIKFVALNFAKTSAGEKSRYILKVLS